MYSSSVDIPVASYICSSIQQQRYSRGLPSSEKR